MVISNSGMAACTSPYCLENAQAIKISIGRKLGLVQHAAHDQMSKKQGRELLDHHGRFITAQRMMNQSMMGISLSESDFNLLAFVVGNYQSSRWRAESNDSATIFELTVPAGAKLPAPAHSHGAYEETLYGLSGIITWTVDGVPIGVGSGQALCIPRDAVRAFANHGAVDAKSLSTLSPAVIEAAEGSPPDRAKMAEVMRRYDLTPSCHPPRRPHEHVSRARSRKANEDRDRRPVKRSSRPPEEGRVMEQSLSQVTPGDGRSLAASANFSRYRSFSYG